MPGTYTSVSSVQVSDSEDIGLLIRHRRLVCASCSSGQRFACGFLRIPPRDGHPCRPANGSPGRGHRSLALPSECALPGAPRKRPDENSPGLIKSVWGQISAGAKAFSSRRNSPQSICRSKSRSVNLILVLPANPVLPTYVCTPGSLPCSTTAPPQRREGRSTEPILPSSMTEIGRGAAQKLPAFRPTDHSRHTLVAVRYRRCSYTRISNSKDGSVHDVAKETPQDHQEWRRRV